VSSVPFEDYSGLADSNEQAARRFELAKSIDPFPEIKPSLLNSADIYDYVRMTGMLYPFHKDKLKSGSYEVAIHGRCIWWDENGQYHERQLERQTQESFTLQANSIAFVQVEPLFRLPDYIALRFNLKITHVHRGILLGTGPLIDPGFEGRLLIPLHNLTTNEYSLECGEGLIWIEFTKTSRLPVAGGEAVNAHGLGRRGKYVPFPESKKNLPPKYYLAGASPHAPIRSSIPEVIRENAKAAQDAARASIESSKEAETARKRVDLILKIFSVAATIGLATAVYMTWDLLHTAWKTVSEVQQQLQLEAANDLSESKEAEQVLLKIQSIESRLAEEITAIRKELNNLNGDVSNLLERKKQSGRKTNASEPQTKLR
jgi:deoxycytidine triphosphate deaminase